MASPEGNATRKKTYSILRVGGTVSVGGQSRSTDYHDEPKMQSQKKKKRKSPNQAQQYSVVVNLDFTFESSIRHRMWEGKKLI